MAKDKNLDDDIKEALYKKKLFKAVDDKFKEEALLPELKVTRLSDWKRSKSERIFGGRLEKGSFSFISGVGEVGKGVLSTDIIARLTTGSPFPGESEWRTPTAVLIAITEDSKDELHGRCEAAGADLDRVHLLEGPSVIRGGIVFPMPLRLNDSAGPMIKKAQELKAGAIFLETLQEHLGSSEGKQHNTNNEAEVRALLAPFRVVCREGGLFGWCAIHPRKAGGEAHERTSGSQAFHSVPRLMMEVFLDPTDEDRNPWRLLATAKTNNLPYRPSTLRFRIDPWEKDKDYPRVVWGIDGKSLEDDRSLNEIVQAQLDKRKVRKDLAVVRAEKFLMKIVNSGELVPPAKLKELADVEGISWISIIRAKKNLGIISKKESVFGGPKSLGWILPEPEM